MQNVTDISNFHRPRRGVSRSRLRRAGPAPFAATGAAIAFGLVASACGTTAQASPPWCEAIGELDATLGSIGDPDPDTVRSEFSNLAATATTIAERAPSKVRTPAAKIQRAIDAGAESGEATLFAPATTSAMAEVHAFAADQCLYEQIQVEASDYAFVGIPDKVLAGKVALSLDNQSETEDHELVLFVKSDGVEAPMAELLGLPEDEAMTKARPVAFTMAEPNGRNGLILDLEPGNYAAVCFVSVGGNDDAEPHFARGMITDFVVG